MQNAIGQICHQAQQMASHGDAVGAETMLRRALKSSSGNPILMSTLADILFEQGDVEDALSYYRRLLRKFGPASPASYKAGVALLALDQTEEAIAVLEERIASGQDDPPTLINLGCGQMGLKRFDAAQRTFERVLEKDAGDVTAMLNLVGAAIWRKDFETARRYQALAERLRPGDVQPILAKAAIAVEEKRNADAVAAYRAALAIQPDPGAAAAMLGAALTACDWRTLKEDEAYLRDVVQKGGMVAAMELTRFAVDDEMTFVNSSRLCEAFHRPLADRPVAKRKAGRLVIGYLSSDIREHAVANLFAGLPEAHDRARFEIVLIDAFGGVATALSSSPMRERILRAVDRTLDISRMPAGAAAQAIRRAGVDILVDLNGHSAGNRLDVLRWRPAPVIVNWMGYPGTMGSKVHDYVICDRETAPEGLDRFYSEAIVRLPNFFLSHDDRRIVAPERPSRREVGLKDDAFVFGSFCEVTKWRPERFESWLDLMRGRPDRQLWLYPAEPEAQANLRAFAAARGVEGESIVFAERLSIERHVARLPLADLMLDTSPYGAHTTALEALWMGVPFVTVEGGCFAGRVCAAALKAAGCEALIAADERGYVEIADGLAQAPARLAAIRADLARRKAEGRLFNTAGFTRQLEAAFETMWARAVSGRPVEAFSI